MSDVTFPTPEDLARGLREGNPAARAEFERLLQPALLKLFERLTQAYTLHYPADYLMARALRLAEVYVRSRPVGSYRTHSQRAFLGEILLHIARLLEQPHGRTTTRPDANPHTLPDCPVYDSQVFYRPFDRVGDAFFGGDWLVGHLDSDGALWLLLADITGHGFTAYLLASALPLVWQMAWDRAGPSAQPNDILANMHYQLESVLPEGIYVEGTLLRLSPQGEITLHAAGGSRVVVRRAGTETPDLLKYRGCWLGLMPPMPHDQHRLNLGPDDELVVGTDGLFDQLEGFRGQKLADHLKSISAPRMFDWVHGLLQESLAAEPQKDDITLLVLRRRAGHRPPPWEASPSRTDVPV